MKSLFFNVYFFTAVVLSGFLFRISYQLRIHPLFLMKTTIEKVLAREELEGIYSDHYLETIEAAYSNQYGASMPLDFFVLIPKDSLFCISLRQIVNASQGESNDIPKVSFAGNNILLAVFHVKAKSNFDIIITCKQTESKYSFDHISNLGLLLREHPEFVSEFERLRHFK